LGLGYLGLVLSLVLMSRSRDAFLIPDGAWAMLLLLLAPALLVTLLGLKGFRTLYGGLDHRIRDMGEPSLFQPDGQH